MVRFFSFLKYFEVAVDTHLYSRNFSTSPQRCTVLIFREDYYVICAVVQNGTKYHLAHKQFRAIYFSYLHCNEQC